MTSLLPHKRTAQSSSGSFLQYTVRRADTPHGNGAFHTFHVMVFLSLYKRDVKSSSTWRQVHGSNIKPPNSQCLLWTSSGFQSSQSSNLCQKLDSEVVRSEFFTAVTMKNGIFWDVTPCASYKNRRFGGT
jgi:hypothetical protein